jgi:hypothetical protein
MKALLSNALTHWQSTVQSILTTTFALTGALMVASIIKPHTAAILASINAVCKVLLGAFQTDGLTVPPGSTVQQNTTIKTPPTP